MIVSASVLVPEPLGPMIAWTSPERTTRSIPFRISLPSTVTCRSLISRSGTGGLLLAAGRGFHQLGERHVVERLRDGRLHLQPDVMRRAARLKHAVHDRLALRGTDLRLDRTFERAHDVTRTDRRGIAREHVAATRTALAQHEAGLAQRGDELLEIRLGEVLAPRDGAQRHGSLAPVTSEVDHEAHSVFAARGNVEGGLGSNSEHLTRNSSRVRIAGPVTRQ